MIKKALAILASPIPLILICVLAGLPPAWLILSLLVMVPTQVALVAWAIILAKTLLVPWFIFSKTLYLLIFISIVLSRGQVKGKIVYKASLFFLILTIIIILFGDLSKLFSIENTALLTYGFLTIGVVQEIASDMSVRAKRLSSFDFLNFIILFSTLVYSFFDEKRHDVIEKYYLPSSKVLRKHWPRIIRSTYALALVISSFYPAYLAFVKERERIKLFVNFFPSNQIIKYLLFTGKYELPVLLITITLVILVYFSKKIAFKIPIIISTFLISHAIAGSIYLSTTRNVRDKAYIWSVTPNQVSEIWTDITVTGVNFKERPFDAFIYVNNIPHRVISWTDREVVFRTDPTLTESGKIRLVNIDRVGSNEVDFTYTPPK